jgi:hypothetical protein
MSHFLCPLCGLSRALSGFTPQKYELDIKLRQVHGLGRGEGFWQEDYSVLGDELYSPIVADRCLDLLKMLLEVGTISPLEVFFKLQVPCAQLYSPEYSKLSRDLEREQYRVKSLEHEMEEKRKKEDKNRIITDFLVRIGNSGLCDTKLTTGPSGIEICIVSYEHEFLMLLFKIYDECSKEGWLLLRKRLSTTANDLAILLEDLDFDKRNEKDVIDNILELRFKPPIKFFPLS